jgi:hypothetical protein
MHFLLILIVLIVTSYSLAGGFYEAKTSTTDSSSAVEGESGAMLCESSPALQTTQIQGCSFISDASGQAEEKIKTEGANLQAALKKGDSQAIIASSAGSALAYSVARQAYQDALNSGSGADTSKSQEKFNSAQRLAVLGQKVIQSNNISTNDLIAFTAKSRSNFDTNQQAVKELLSVEGSKQRYPMIRKTIDSSNIAAAAQVQLEGRLRAENPSLINLQFIGYFLPKFLPLFEFIIPETYAQATTQIVEAVILAQESLNNSLQNPDYSKVNPLYQQLLKAEENLVRSSTQDAVAKAKEALKESEGFSNQAALSELEQILQRVE